MKGTLLFSIAAGPHMHRHSEMCSKADSSSSICISAKALFYLEALLYRHSIMLDESAMSSYDAPHDSLKQARKIVYIVKYIHTYIHTYIYI